MADKVRDQLQFDQLQNRFIGVGNADTEKHEWRENVARDSYASYIGHPALLEHFSLALGESKMETKQRFIDVCTMGKINKKSIY